MSTDPAEAIRRRDEILQVMFWMHGEGLADVVGPAELGVFLNEDTLTALAADLAALAASGLLEIPEDGRYRLSRRGRKEAGRRFQEEFEELMHQGHGACSDPNCDCHTLGPEACAHAHA
jgi:hypothetical protein